MVKHKINTTLLDIDIGLPKVTKIESEKSNDALKKLKDTLNVDEYLAEKHEKMKELYEIMSKNEVEELLKKAQFIYSYAISVDQVVDILLKNLRTWNLKMIQPSSEEGYKKEKELIDLLVSTKLNYKNFEAGYKNYYEILHDEILAIDPDALNPTKATDKFSELKSNALVKSGNAITNKGVTECDQNNPLTLEVL